MSIQAVAWAIEQEDVPARAALVLISIANHADHTDGYCWLKAETIAREARCKPRSVFRFIAALVRNGYVRKSPRRGDDGKQRANDYWLLFDREDRPWDWGAQPDEAQGEVEEIATDDGDAPQDVVDPTAPTDRDAYGESDGPPPVDKHAVSCGPCDSGVIHKDSAEPSKINPKASAAREGVQATILRRYRPPPPQPVAADTEAKGNPIFVFEGTPAYDAWRTVMARRNRVPSWHLTTKAQIDGKWRTGWWFPTLFPPKAQPPPTDGTGLSEQDMRDFK